MGSWVGILFGLEDLTKPQKTKIVKKYRKKSAYIRIEGIVSNPQTAAQVPLRFECRVDTGFDGGVLVPVRYKPDTEAIGVTPAITNVTLADGNKIPAYVCAAYLQAVDKHVFKSPGKPVTLIMCGFREGQMLGMDALKYCTIVFDGPKQDFTITI